MVRGERLEVAGEQRGHRSAWLESEGGAVAEERRGVIGGYLAVVGFEEEAAEAPVNEREGERGRCE